MLLLKYGSVLLLLSFIECQSNETGIDSQRQHLMASSTQLPDSTTYYFLTNQLLNQSQDVILHVVPAPTKAIPPYELDTQQPTLGSEQPSSTTTTQIPSPENVMTVRPTESNQIHNYSSTTAAAYPYSLDAELESSRSRNIRSNKQHFCGNTLKQVLRLVCDGKYYGGQPNETRRAGHAASGSFNLTQLLMSISGSADPAPIAAAESNAIVPSVAPPSPIEVTSSIVDSSNPGQLENESSSVQSGPEQAAEGKRNRNVRGIVEECCRKSCSLADLRMYCLNRK